ncbi:MAG: NAD(P)/FAD-dependent oxidoreductase [Flavobacteriales bacterium]|nr:NAD(P)/FAD-dependent oxidoreductase [Flavobacteriales bacterium]
MQPDTIIMGSGAGGLSAALCLARAGNKVLVLEQHYVPGGWCHSFFLNGHRFSPGVHYIGMMGEGESTRELYEGLGIANDLVFFRMNPAAYEHCWIGEHRIDMPAGIDNLYEHLAQRFPHERKGLKRYLATVRNVSDQLQLIHRMSGFLDHLTIPFRTRHLGKYGLFSLKRVIDWHIKDPLLKKVLNVQCGDHGLPPSLAPFPVHAAVMQHYFDGGYYPMGGGAGIVKAMTTAIKKHGGVVRTDAGVKRILLEGDGKAKRAVGVELMNGERINASTIVSNADPHKTYIGMVGKEHLDNKVLKKLAATRYSVTSIMLFVTVDMDVRAAGLDSGNIWMLRNVDMEELFRDMSRTDILTDDEFPGAFISCPTLKDPTSFNGRYHDIEMVTYLDYKAFEPFEGLGERTAEYGTWKDRIKEKMLNGLERVLPGVRARIVQAEIGTPITNEHYVQSTRGSVYGTEKTLKHVGPFAFGVKAPIQGLYLTGASTLTHGVAGASISGVITAAAVLGCTKDDLLKPDPSQRLRIHDAEDETTWPDWVRVKRADKRRRFKPVAVRAAT